MWRLPTVRELLDEFKKTGSTPAGFQEHYYWSCDTPSENSDYADIVFMCSGEVGRGYKKTDSRDFFVRLVH